MTRSDQPEPPAVAIVRQNGLLSASSRASVADTPMFYAKPIDNIYKNFNTNIVIF